MTTCNIGFRPASQRAGPQLHGNDRRVWVALLHVLYDGIVAPGSRC
jgi:hypothetical protein